MMGLVTVDMGASAKLNVLGKRNTLTGTPYWIAPEVVLEQGYNCVVASTCALESIGPGNYGVMVISRIAPTSVAFGFGDTTDRELAEKGE